MVFYRVLSLLKMVDNASKKLEKILFDEMSYDPTVSNPQEIAYGLPRYVPFWPTTGIRGHDCQPNQYFQLALDYESVKITPREKTRHTLLSLRKNGGLLEV